MNRPTKTRQELRRALALRLSMPFNKRVADGYGTATSGTTTTLVDNVNLLQAGDFWNSQWLYNVTKDEVRNVFDNTFDNGFSDILVYETIAVDGLNVKRAFVQICREIVMRYYETLKQA